MKVFLAAAVLAGVTLLSTPAAQAQTTASTASTSREEQAKQANEAGLRKRKSSPDDLARMQRRMSMNPDEVKRDQQMEVLEARSGVSSYSSGSGKRSYEKGNGAFTVQRFRDKNSAAMQKRGQSRPAPGIDPKGKPLKHKKDKKFLLF
ncbi:hypothetical protein [Hymenobacter sp. B81]|uniref:hypothetical protein n=1 Tax=Hymenobacter sp. B81 TaxID=3344878 RepID=UPI0037DD505E